MASLNPPTRMRCHHCGKTEHQVLAESGKPMIERPPFGVLCDPCYQAASFEEGQIGSFYEDLDERSRVMANTMIQVYLAKWGIAVVILFLILLAFGGHE